MKSNPLNLEVKLRQLATIVLVGGYITFALGVLFFNKIHDLFHLTFWLYMSNDVETGVWIFLIFSPRFLSIGMYHALIRMSENIQAERLQEEAKYDQRSPGILLCDFLPSPLTAQAAEYHGRPTIFGDSSYGRAYAKLLNEAFAAEGQLLVFGQERTSQRYAAANGLLYCATHAHLQKEMMLAALKAARVIIIIPSMQQVQLDWVSLLIQHAWTSKILLFMAPAPDPKGNLDRYIDINASQQAWEATAECWQKAGYTLPAYCRAGLLCTVDSTLAVVSSVSLNYDVSIKNLNTTLLQLMPISDVGQSLSTLCVALTQGKNSSSALLPQ